MKLRYRFVLTVLFILYPMVGNSLYIEKLLGPTSPEYIQEYFSRMYGWYNNNFFDFNKNLSSSEKDILKLWKSNLSQWGVKIDENFYRENFIFTHDVKGQSVRHGSLYIGKKSWTNEEVNQLKVILKERNINLDGEFSLKNLLGIKWNFDQSTLSIYFLRKDENKIRFIEYTKSAVIRKGIIQKTDKFTVPLVGSTKYDVSSAAETLVSGEERVVQLRFRAFFVLFLSEPARIINIKHFKEFRQPMASMEITNKDEYRIFYP